MKTILAIVLLAHWTAFAQPMVTEKTIQYIRETYYPGGLFQQRRAISKEVWAFNGDVGTITYTFQYGVNSTNFFIVETYRRDLSNRVSQFTGTTAVKVDVFYTGGITHSTNDAYSIREKALGKLQDFVGDQKEYYSDGAVAQSMGNIVFMLDNSGGVNPWAVEFYFAGPKKSFRWPTRVEPRGVFYFTPTVENSVSQGGSGGWFGLHRTISLELNHMAQAKK